MDQGLNLVLEVAAIGSIISMVPVEFTIFALIFFVESLLDHFEH